MQRAIRQAKGGFQQWPGLQVTSLLKGLDLSEASFQSSIPRLQLSPSLQLTWIHRLKRQKQIWGSVNPLVVL